MRTTTTLHPGPGRAAIGWGLCLFLAVLCPPSVRAQDWQPLQEADTAPALPAPAVRQRIFLFRFAPGFICDPIGVQDEDDTPPGSPSTTPTLPPEPDSGPDWIQVAMGMDNPYFDFRQRGDPGGLGYYRLYTQVQLVQTMSTSCTVNMQAVSPAGLQYLGVADGPTIVSPAFALFHAIDDCTAVQGFIGKSTAIEHGSLYSPTYGPLQRNVRCGMAVQRALTSTGPDPLRNVYLYLGALGQYHLDREETTAPPATLKMLPGVHWRLSSTSWLSGGFLVPVGSGRPPDSPLPWQVTWSLQF